MTDLAHAPAYLSERAACDALEAARAAYHAAAFGRCDPAAFAAARDAYYAALSAYARTMDAQDALAD